ncbi:hypothetical protein F5B20DRAFT_528711 [Whalleya microplaca]|nr:hypothetical protein F5B20DRAFT_528711 [Whalleya microplaca]
MHATTFVSMIAAFSGLALATGDKTVIVGVENASSPNKATVEAPLYTAKRDPSFKTASKLHVWGVSPDTKMDIVFCDAHLSKSSGGPTFIQKFSKNKPTEIKEGDNVDYIFCNTFGA